MPNSLTITTLFDSFDSESSTEENLNHQLYRDVILRTLRKILPVHFFEQKETEEATYYYQKSILQKIVPLITCSEIQQFPGALSFFVLSKHRPNSFRFFFEMISRWLTPGRQLNVVLAYASDFCLTHLGDDVYTICELRISLDSAIDLAEIQRHFPLLGNEIALGIHSEFYAQRILASKGLTVEDKISSIQDSIAFLMKRFPHVYDRDFFTEMQHILVTCRDDFKSERQPRHLSRIIGVQYLFRQNIKEAIKKNAQRRYLNLKISRAFIQTPMGRKRVLSLLVGMNFFRDQETFGEKHLLKAIQHYVPTAVAVEHSFFMNKRSDHICISYLEIEKKDGSDFSGAEIRTLRRELPANLKNRIEHRLHPVFMPRNEEEVMRNILILTHQLKYVRDIPQVLIMFDEQAYAHLYFTIILVRILKPESRSIPEIFKQTDTTFEYLYDRTKIMGYIRKKYAKEASVFRLKLPKDCFLRADHSIDLYKARQTVVNELTHLLGEIRDYNGGMISKQHELLLGIQRQLVDVKRYDELLLENFFYSLAPVVVRALLDPKAFKTLFLMLNEGIKEFKHEGYYLKFYTEPYNVFALVIVEDIHVKDLLNRAIQELHIPATELAYAHVKTHGSMCLGYICCARDPQKKEQLFQVIEQTLMAWDQNHQAVVNK